MKPWSGRSKNTSDLMAMTGGGAMEGKGGVLAREGGGVGLFLVDNKIRRV